VNASPAISLVVAIPPDNPRETERRSGEVAHHLAKRAVQTKNLENSIIDYALIC